MAIIILFLLLKYSGFAQQENDSSYSTIKYFREKNIRCVLLNNKEGALAYPQNYSHK